MKATSPSLALAISLGVVSSLACAGGTRLPAVRPADFSVSYSQSGGMMPEFTRYSCSSAECSYEGQTQGPQGQIHVGPVTAVPGAAQMDALYAVVRAHAFDRLKVEHHGIIYDAGGSDIGVTAGGQSWNFGDGAEESVATSSQPDFAAVSEALGGLIRDLKLVPGAGASQ